MDVTENDKMMQHVNSKYIVEIKDIYMEEDDDVVFVHEQLHVLLRDIISVLINLLKAFQSAAICKEVSSMSQQ
jgi:hypothetical protein